MTPMGVIFGFIGVIFKPIVVVFVSMGIIFEAPSPNVVLTSKCCQTKIVPLLTQAPGLPG